MKTKTRHRKYDLFALLMRLIRKDKERFIARLTRNLSPVFVDGQWHMLWTGNACSGNGYPTFNIAKPKATSCALSFYVHDVFWVLQSRAPKPPDMEVDHECAINRCVSHLQLVTKEENVRLENARIRERKGREAIAVPF